MPDSIFRGSRHSQASMTIVVLHQGATEKLLRTLAGLEPVPCDKLVVVNIGSSPLTTSLLPLGTRYIECPNTTPATGWNAGIGGVKTDFVLTVSDRLIARPEAVAELRAQVTETSPWVLGRLSRKKHSLRSPLVTFLVNSGFELPFDEVQDTNKVSADFFDPSFSCFRKRSFDALGAFDESIGHRLYAADLGRRAYLGGDTLKIVAEAEAIVQHEPLLPECLEAWQNFGSELVPFWEKYPDSQVCYLGTDALSRWATRNVASAARRQLEELDAKLRSLPVAQLSIIAKVQPLYAQLATYTISQAALSKSARLRKLLAGDSFSVAQNTRTEDAAVPSL